MLTLHGFPFSNYHNIVKHALMYKGIPFDEHIVYPNTPEMMAVNPTGKAPAMTTEQGTSIAESSVLVDYLEDAYPETPLYPADADARAKVRHNGMR
jgi:glutathione S-transferase